MAVMSADALEMWGSERLLDGSATLTLSFVGLVAFAMHLGSLKAPFGHVVRPLGHGWHHVISNNFGIGPGINEFGHDRVPGGRVDVLHGRVASEVGAPGHAPVADRYDHFAKIFSRLGWQVLVPGRAGLVRLAENEPFIGQPGQAVGQDVGGDAKRLHQFVEPSQAEQKIAQYEDAPSITEHRDRGGDRTDIRIFARWRAGWRWLSGRFPHVFSIATFDPQVGPFAGDTYQNVTSLSTAIIYNYVNKRWLVTKRSK